MKQFPVIVACAVFALFFVACEGNNNNKKDGDTVIADDDNLLAEEDGIATEEEPEGEDVDQKTDKDTVAKDDAPVVTDDGTIEPDDATVEPDDAMIEPDDATGETDDTIIESDDAMVVPDDDTAVTYPIGWCNLQSPTDPTITTGDEVTIYGRVYVAGLTDLSTAVDSAEELLVEVGIGNAGSDIATWNWGGVDITPNPDNASAPEIGNNDEYIFSAVVPIPAGSYDYTFRFSGDNGATWTYCNANRPPDYNGTDENTPFDVAKVGHLTVQDEVQPDDDAVVTDDGAADDTVTDDVLPDADTATALTVGWCNLQYPVTLTVTEGDDAGYFYGRLYVAGVTDKTDGYDYDDNVTAQFGWGAAGSDASTWATWVGAAGNESFVDNSNDEYRASFSTTLTAGMYDYTFRFSADAGTTWTYCNGNDDPNYNGTDAGHPYDLAKNGHLTVESAYVDPCAAEDNPCTDLHKTVCTDTNTDGVAECACDTDYHDDGGTCVSSVQTVACTNVKPAENSHWVNTGPYSGGIGEVTQTWDGDSWEPAADSCPWVCDATFVLDDYGVCVPEGGPCADSPCTDEFKHVCADDGIGGYTCSCDEHYTDNGGTCEPDTRSVACVNALPAKAVWSDTGIYDGAGNLEQSWTGDGWAPTDLTCPWVCDTDYFREGDVCINEMSVDCALDPAKPDNSHNIVEQVTIHYTTLDGWGLPSTCEWACDDGFHWNDTEDACLETLTIGWCNLQYPTDATVEQGADLTVYGRVYIAGVTDLTAGVDAMPQIIGQLSGNPSSGVDAATWPWDGWMDLEPNPDNESSPDIGDNDEYMITVPVMADPGEMDITIRFSGDSGATWTYCNANRPAAEPEGYNGTDAENPYDPLKHGHLTVTPGYLDPCAMENPCTALHQTVCTDTDLNGVAECACDEDYTFDGGETCINTKQVNCAANPAKPANSHDVTELVTVNYTDAEGWENPATCTNWACNLDYHWNDTEAACLETLTIGWCNLQYPTDTSFYRGETVAVYGRVYVEGLTALTTEVDTAPQLIMQIGSGPAGTDATGWGDQWGPMEPNPDNEISPEIGNNDEYQYVGPVIEAIDNYDMLVRVSGDSGATWTYCNANRSPEYNGTDTENPYDYLKNGHFTVTSPCEEGFCAAPHKSVCADDAAEPYYICSCDENYSDDGDGNCVADSQKVLCVNSLPTNAHWNATGVYDGSGNVTQTWNGEDWVPANTTCPWACDTDYHQDGNTCVFNTQTVVCTNVKPAYSHWVNTGPYSGEPNGTVTQTWNDTDWTPADNTCPWACDATYHQEGELCVSDTKTVSCTNTKPADSHWVNTGIYSGEPDGAVTQTWDGDSYEPADTTCPWACDTDYHYETSSGQCVGNTIGRLCTNTLPAGATWVAEAPYDGSGNLLQTWVGPGDEDWEPTTDTCPWDCLTPGYHANYEVNECLLTLTIDWCNLQFPATVSGPWGGIPSTTIYGQLYIAGVTSTSTLEGGVFTPFKPQVKAQLGYGGRDTDPATWNHWMDTAANVKVGNNEEYQATPVFDMYPGLYDYAYRFSGDSGVTWFYCDTTGTSPSDPYLITSSGKLTVSCSQDTDCDGNAATPFCGPAGNCVECADSGDCPAWAQCNGSYQCEPQPGRCGNKDDDCTDPDMPVCNSDTNYCVECTANTDCTDLAKPICSASLNTCGPNAVYFSEYIEGSSNNKAMEVYNGTPDTIDLTKYRVRLFANGALIGNPTATLNLNTCGTSSTLDTAGLLMIVHSSAVPALQNLKTCNSSVMNYNGDDAIILEYTEDGSTWVIIDTFGIVGTDPGSSWTIAGDTTGAVDNTVVRKNSVALGNTNWSLSAGTNVDDSEWTIYAVDVFTYFGTR